MPFWASITRDGNNECFKSFWLKRRKRETITFHGRKSREPTRRSKKLNVKNQKWHLNLNSIFPLNFFSHFFRFSFLYTLIAQLYTCSYHTEQTSKGGWGWSGRGGLWGEGLQLCNIALMQQCSLITLHPHPGFIPVQLCTLRRNKESYFGL